MKVSTSAHLLTCLDLSVGYKDKVILSGLNLSFEAGQFISLLGPNGAGKTTLLRTLSRHLTPICGRVLLQQKPLDEMRQSEVAKTMAVVLTDKVSPPLFSVFEFAALGRYPHTGFLGRLTDGDREVVENALAAVRADSLAHRQFAQLSDGERQKVLVARALVQEPQVLLLDEPTAHLDLKHRMEVMGILRSLCRSKGITVVASMHDVDIAAKVSDRVALVKDGSITAWGAAEEVLRTRTVADLYDFEGVNFDQHLGSIELRGDGSSGRAFVVAGGGKGALIYRLLAKRGFSIATGIMHTHDIDYYVAKSLGAECSAQPPLESLNGPVLEKALENLDHCDCVIDTGFDVGPWNQSNVELLKAAVQRGKKVFTLREKGIPAFADAPVGGLVVCRGVTPLLDAVERHMEETRTVRQA